MAAPREKTLQDMTGKWSMNKSLSDPIDPILQLQGIGWITRQALYYATVNVAIKQSVDENACTHFEVIQSIPGMPSSLESLVLDWKWHDHKSPIFGDVLGRAHWSKPSEFDDQHDFLTDGWDETETDCVELTFRSEKNGWTATQVWGFVTLDTGLRYHARRVVVRHGEKSKCAALIYDYKHE